MSIAGEIQFSLTGGDIVSLRRDIAHQIVRFVGGRKVTPARYRFDVASVDAVFDLLFSIISKSKRHHSGSKIRSLKIKALPNRNLYGWRWFKQPILF